jgi:hypothetical protein
VDVEIDQIALDDVSIQSASLHAKYLEMLTKTKLELKYFESILDIAYKDKWLYYTGKMDKDRIQQLGWSPDPLNGLRILKSDLDYYYKADAELQELSSKIDLAKITKETLEEIIGHIRFRSTNIKNIIEWRKFMSGS